MENLIQDLQKMITALEQLGHLSQADSEQIDELLDQLFQQKIDLLRVSLNVSSQPFQQTAQAIHQAAAKLDKTVKHPSDIQASISQVQIAVNKLAKLLDQAPLIV